MEYSRSVLKVSISDVIVTQKGFNGDGKLHFYGRDYILLALFVQKTSLGKDTVSMGENGFKLMLQFGAICCRHWPCKGKSKTNTV